MSGGAGAKRTGRLRVWVVEPGRRPTLGDIVQKLGAGQSALPDGRVFVDGRRVQAAGERLEPGQRVELHPSRRAGGEVELLDQRDGVVAALKPAELPTEPDHHGLDSLRGRVAGKLGVAEAGVHALSRLDVGVSGVVLLASSKAARRHVESVRQRGGLRRRYVGVTERAPDPGEGCWDAPVKGPSRGRAGIATRGGDGRPAETRYVVLGEVAAPLSSVGRDARALRPALVAFEPVTGRTHQIRIHAASAGAPLLGDRLYRGVCSIALSDGRVIEASRILLHAAWVELPDAAGRTWRVRAPEPPDLVELWRDLGGGDGPWQGVEGPQGPGVAARVE